MKKFAIVCAIVLAAGLSSCGDTNYCYEVKYTLNASILETTVTTYEWCTSNELDARIEDYKKTIVEKYGVSEDLIKVEYSKANKSQDDCHK